MKSIKDIIQKKLFKSEFNRNVLTLMTGTTIAQALPIAVTPILTRLYSPEEFGFFALFLATITILGSAVNGRYEQAILLPSKNDDAINVAALGLLIAFFFFSILLFLVIIFNSKITILLGNDNLRLWLYIVPFVVLIIGLFNILNYLNIRKKKYMDIAKAKIFKSSVMSSLQLFLGYLKFGVSGLIIGQVISQIVANFQLAKNSKKNYNLNKIKKKDILRVAKKYIKFPKYSLWAGLLNISSHQTTSILISFVYGMKSLGFYFLPFRVLGLPTSLISGAIGDVFFQQASAEKIKTGTAKITFVKTFKKLICISFLIFFPIYWVIEDLFIFVFGESWAIAGLYAKILTPLFFIQFCISPLTTMNVIFKKNEVSLYWQIVLFFLHSGLIAIFYFLKISIEIYLQTMVIVIGTHYIVMLVIISSYNKKRNKS